MRQLSVGLVLVLVWSVGCGGDSHSTVDGGPTPDSGAAIVDSGSVDSGSVDSGTIGDASNDGGVGTEECDPGCEAGSQCVRGVCLATCGMDLAGFDPALSEALQPVVNLCRPSTQAMDVIESEGGALRVYELVAEGSGTTTTFTLSRFTLMPDGTPSSTETLGSAMYEGVDASMTYAGSYLDIAPGEHSAIFGYTTMGPGFIGGVFDLDLGEGTATEVPAPGNFDAVWIDDSRWILDGMGLGTEMGQGLYVHDSGAGVSRLVANEMGVFSGSVALLGDVIVAGAFGTAGVVFVFDRDALLDAETPLDAREDAIASFETSSAFELVFGTRLSSVTYGSEGISGIEARALREEAGEWALGAAEPLTNGALFTNITASGADRAWLHHAGGVLLVELPSR